LAFLAAAAEPEIDCARLPAVPRLDGSLDEPAWAEAPVTTIGDRRQLHPLYRDAWSGASDLSARLRVGARGGNLYLGIEVTDDAAIHEAERPFWVGDSIELFFDSDPRARQLDDGYGPDDWQLFLLPFHPGLRWAIVSRGEGTRYPAGGWSGVEIACQTRPGGYTLEALIPLSNLAPLRPDEAGRIGFDVALNDVDLPGATQTKSYATLSGRFDLYRLPANFASLRIGPAIEEPAADLRSSAGWLDWRVFLGGIAGVIVLGLSVRRIARRIARRTRLRNAVLILGFLAGAGLVLLLPSLLGFLDERFTRGRHAERVSAVAAAASEFLRLDAAPPGQAGESGARLLALLRDGKVRIRPRYRYHYLPVTPAALAPPPSESEPGSIRFGILLEPDVERSFPLDLAKAPRRLRLDLGLPDEDDRIGAETPAALVGLELADEVRTVTVPAGGIRHGIWFDLDPNVGALRSVRVRNLLSHRPIAVDALYGREESGAVRPLPLVAYSPAGIPINVWRDRPLSHIAALPKQGAHRIPDVGQPGERLWFAVAAEGAYPRIQPGGDALEVRVRYGHDEEGPTLRLQNGPQLQDREILFSQLALAPERVALEWEAQNRVPVHYSLHSIALDPRRPVGSVEFADLGVVGSIRVVAVTLGERLAQPPSPASGLMLADETLTARREAFARFSGLGFRVRVGGRTVGAASVVEGVRDRIPLAFDGGATGELEVFLPRAPLVDLLLRSRRVFVGGAALLAAFAAVVAGAGLLHRARRIRVKMLVALASATAAPLLFLFAALTSLLNEREESALRDASLQALRTVMERVAVSKARARDLASRSRDWIDRAPAPDAASLSQLVRGQRASLEADGAFLRLPGIDPSVASPLGNVSFFDPIVRSGLYFSPWDGVVAVGVARLKDARPCIVGLRPPAVLGAAPRECTALLFGPAGEPVAASPDEFPPAFASAEARAEARRRVAAIESLAAPLYEPDLAAGGGARVAAAWDLLREGNQAIGLVGVLRSRAGTEQAKAAILETLFLAGLAALLLVVLAGSTLADRVTLRLRRVAAAARALASGELSRRVPVEAEDELSRLADSFNAMADALDGRMRQLTDLHASLEALTSALDEEEVARTAAQALARATGARHVLVASVDAASGRVETLHRAGSGAPLPTRLPERGPEREAADRRAPHFAEGAIYLPLVASARTVGLAVASPVAEEGADRAHLDALGRQIGVALEKARLFRLAVTDEASGVYTHAYFLRRLREEVDRAAASGRRLSLVRVSVVAFAELRTRFGAAAAARLFGEIAETVDGATPVRMLTARREAGELEVLLVEADAEEARKSMEAIAAALSRRAFPGFEGGDRPLFSFHAVTYPDDGAAPEMLLEALARGPAGVVETGPDAPSALLFPEIVGDEIGRSPAMRPLLDAVARVARTDATVLLTGETGSGKEVLADIVQANSLRRDGPYVKVNCAAIPETLIESELFGHERGAFTGADRRRIGRFEQAHRGTLFLDEIGDLPPAAQVKLLRVLQERKFHRVGGSEPVEVDVRILCATHRDLEGEIAAGRFREDLFHRLNVIHLRVPPLRERREELLPLLKSFLERFNRRHGLRIESFAPDALDLLYAHSWPGNIRELRNVVERSMLLSAGPVVTRAQLALGPDSEGRAPAPPPLADGLTPRQERVLRAARQSGGVSNGDVVESEKISARTALRELQTLVERGLLHRVGRRRGAIYRPPE